MTVMVHLDEQNINEQSYSTFDQQVYSKMAFNVYYSSVGLSMYLLTWYSWVPHYDKVAILGVG